MGGLKFKADWYSGEERGICQLAVSILNTKKIMIHADYSSITINNLLLTFNLLQMLIKWRIFQGRITLFYFVWTRQESCFAAIPMHGAIPGSTLDPRRDTVCTVQVVLVLSFVRNSISNI